jgi:hypothetical protein
MADYGFATVSTRDLVLGEQRRVKANAAQGLYTGCQASVYPVCEPFKVRTITKGNAFAYALANGLQKAMHRHLKRTNQFALIGEPVTSLRAVEWLTEMSPTGLWVSGDYSGATDLIKIELTKVCFEAVLSELGQNEVYNDIVRRVLYEHEIHYPKGSGPDGTDLPPVKQANGQLMGSVLSFPVLCAINLAHYWHSVEPEVTNFRQLKALVNGDDILFRTQFKQYENWYGSLHEAGFVPSPGKNFCHPAFFTINSQLFAAGQHVLVPEKIPFFNTGLLYGQSKVGAREDEAAKPVYLLHNPCVAGALNPKRASSRFLAINRFEMEQCSSHRGIQLNYFVAPELGGLGLVPPPGTQITSDPNCTQPSTIHVTGHQRRLAQYLYDRWTVDYTTPPAGPVGMPKRLNDVALLGCIEVPHSFEIACQLGALYELETAMGLSQLGGEVARKRFPPVERRVVRRLVETSEFLVPHARVVLPEGPGPKNAKLNELSDKDMLKLSYRWQMPSWSQTTSTVPTLSSASVCRKRFLEVTESLEDLCIPEHFCY